MNHPANQLEPKKPWVTPQLVELDIKRITQLMDQQEVDLMNYLANDPDAFKLMTGSVSSDYRLKKDIKDFNATTIIAQLQAYKYAWKNGAGSEYGVLAHELQAVLPYLVTGQKDEVDAEGNPVIQRVNYAKLVPVLLKAIQEQQQLLQDLGKQVDALSKKIEEAQQVL
ncbi:MAG: tail fiber domain-containing protein [Chitinophagaceae bacterium]|jgi:Chaperone of endosialidase|nr:tail fiber domain-containing protein [Chitinophagaceae bacterium]